MLRATPAVSASNSARYLPSLCAVLCLFPMRRLMSAAPELMPAARGCDYAVSDVSVVLLVGSRKDMFRRKFGASFLVPLANRPIVRAQGARIGFAANFRTDSWPGS